MHTLNIADVSAYIAHLLDLPLSAEESQKIKYLAGDALNQQILEAVCQLVSQQAGHQPLILVWDDLHWVDPSSLMLLEVLLSLTKTCPVLIVLIYRATHITRIRGLSERLASLTDALHLIDLPPLNETESQALINNLLGEQALPPAISQLIIYKAGGNPFYIEEVVRSLIDRRMVAQIDKNWHWVAEIDTAAITLPDTLQGIIMARVDSLSPAAKRTLQVASVAGRIFFEPVLNPFT